MMAPPIYGGKDREIAPSSTQLHKMKTPTKRSIPPPIDLSVSGSNFMRETTRDHRPCAYGEGIGSADQGGIPAQLSVSPGISSSKSTGTRTSTRPATNDSTALLPGDSYFSTSRLAPNRRRSYSESAYAPSQQPGSGGILPPTPASFHSTSSSPKTAPLKPSLSFTLGFRKSKTSTPRDRCVSTEGRRNKLWSSLAQLPLNLDARPDSGKGGDGISSTMTPRKSRRPGTSPSTPSSYTSFLDTGSSSISTGGKSGSNREDVSRKPRRPGTASSTGSGSFSLRMSKLDWKPLSLLRPSSSSLSTLSPQKPSPSSSFTSSPSTPSLSSSSSPPSPDSPQCLTPLTPKEADGQRLRNRVSTKCGSQQLDPKLIMLVNNRPTPNLQAPALSREDLGKVNAFYAPPPPAHSMQALSTPKVKSGPLHPPETPKTMPRSRPGPIQTSINTPSIKSQGIPISLPLSPISSIGSHEPESSVLYLTVEDAWDEESGEVTHQLVEVYM